MIIDIDGLAFFTVIALGIVLTALFTYALETVRRPAARSDDEGALSPTSAGAGTSQAAERGKVPV